MLIMPRPRDKRLQRETDRHGNTRWYVRSGHGPRTRIRGEYGTKEFNSAVEDAVAGRKPQALSRSGGTAGTVQWLADTYMASSRWAALKPATRKQRGNFLRGMTDKVGQQPVAAIDRASVKASFEARGSAPFAARNWLKTMRALFSWAVEMDMVSANPTTEIKGKRLKTRGFLPWTEEDQAAFKLRWPTGTRERLAFEIIAGTGLRKGDAVRLGRPHVRKGEIVTLMDGSTVTDWITITTEKTGQPVVIPMLPQLRAAIAAGPCGDFTFIATASRRPMSKFGFGNWFGDACRAAGLIRKSAHGIRKSNAALAAENGFSESQLNAWFGWAEGSQESATYTRSARRQKLTADGASKLFGNKTETSIPSPLYPVREVI